MKKEKSIFKIISNQLRLYQWSKNLLLFVPALADHQIIKPSVFINIAIGFFAFSMLASSIYVFNDILDINYDRKHPNKKTRPIAVGDLSIFSAYAIMLVCFLLGMFAAQYLGNTFFLVAISYIALNLLYSFYFKTVIILDVILLMSFYTLRLIAGHLPDSIPFSSWLLSFSIFLFFSLALLKRYVDTIIMREHNASLISGHGYFIEDGNILMSLGVASGLVSSLVLILYTGSEEVQNNYNTPMILVALAPVVLYWVSRMWLLAERGLIKSDPVLFAVKDKITYAVAIMFLAILLLAKYFGI